MELLYVLDQWIIFALKIAALPVGGYALLHAVRQRADAFTAAGKLTKNAWLGITGVGLFLLIITPGPMYGGAMFWLAAMVAVLVYIVDVKPAVVEVQGGGPRW
ncbi:MULTISPECIES: DUF2516 family protein [Pseudonocardia]|uniref:DUF2516 domain-containing protein n=2 Tax=Pseudonocardia TaxID=1847 RepID=A0A1Y2MSH5_PSEAH|nr:MULTISPECIES: DUF2516 family protein [Pseudonocardia]OSY38091.1 hypothetical protein BG845_04264 [Pseudonocardia autotrophica]TDN75532.1 uncharacterized protein DUF2516 [Pseudonocardia autotrophica]BBF99502.1 hypothetical protein Pdca_07120 [Pseudonocardia autotrophica]GEC28503.1 hypothetical protein PSA01_55320 [Pseudonocardia saturnea]